MQKPSYIEKDNSDEITVNVLNDSLKKISILSLTNCDTKSSSLKVRCS